MCAYTRIIRIIRCRIGRTQSGRKLITSSIIQHSLTNFKDAYMVKMSSDSQAKDAISNTNKAEEQSAQLDNTVQQPQVEPTTNEQDLHEEDQEEDEDEEELPVSQLLEEAKRSFALRQWDQAIDGYGRTLEVLSAERGEDDPIFAPLHHRYGHALLEHAIATSGALGGGGGGGKDAPMPSRSGAGGASTVASARAHEGKKTSRAAEPSSTEKPSDPRFTFGGDAEESDDEDAAGAPQGEDEEQDDDLGDAFSVLELARVQYEKLLEQGVTLTTLDGEQWSTLIIRGQLAEVLNDLADVGLESENFQQASSDYQSALDLLEPLLQPHSRRLADAYLRLGLALEFHPDASMQASAERYVTSACMVLRKRLEALDERRNSVKKGQDGTEQQDPAKAEAAAEAYAEKVQEESAARLREEGVLAPDGSSRNNGKGKATELKSDESVKLEKDNVLTMEWQALEKETSDIKEMVRELELKLEEYANAPPGTANGAASASSGSGQGALGSAETKAALQQAINEALLGASTNAITANGNASGSGSGAAGITTFGGLDRTADPSVTINDLSAMVKKKKRSAPQPDIDEGSASVTATASAAAAADVGDANKKARVEDVPE